MVCSDNKNEESIKLQLLFLTRDIWYRLSEKKHYGLNNIDLNNKKQFEINKQKVIKECLNEIELIYNKLVELLKVDIDLRYKEKKK